MRTFSLVSVPTVVNLNNTTPAPPSGAAVVSWLADNLDPRNVLGYVTGGPYHVVFYLPGLLTTGYTNEPVLQWTCPNDLTAGVSFGVDFNSNARGYLQANPTASTVTCLIYKVPSGSAAGTLGTNIGSIVISSTGTLAFHLTAAATFLPGDSLTVWPPASLDPTLAGVGWTLPGKRN